MNNRLDTRLPSIAYMEQAAKRRIPRFVFEFLQSGIGAEHCLKRNRDTLDEIKFLPQYLTREPIGPSLETSIFGQTFPAPFAPTPIGLSGLMWPRAAEIIAKNTSAKGLPVGLSMWATASIEEIAAMTGNLLWYQLLCTTTPEIENDLIDRAEAAGCEVLIVTVDIPTITRREKDIANGLSVPPRFNLSTLLQISSRPAWALAMLQAGIPRFKSLLRYVPENANIAETARFLADIVDVNVTIDKLETIRKRWTGQLVVKGILGIDDALCCKELGVDGIVVSNHGGRQFDAAPAAPHVLPHIRDAVGPDMVLMADGGVRSGLDIARLVACGADFVLIGRPFIYAVAAAGANGVDHLIFVLQEELRQTLAQLGCQTLAEIEKRRIL